MLHLGEGCADVLSLVEVVHGMLDRDAESRGGPIGEVPEWMVEGRRRREVILLPKKAADRQNLQALEQCFRNCADANELMLRFKQRLDLARWCQSSMP